MPGRGSSASIAGCWRQIAPLPRPRFRRTEGCMRFSLINPPWTFDSSIYFGCREPHLPLEYGYSKALLEKAGHEVEIIDGQLDALSYGMVVDRVAAFRPHSPV